MATWQEHIGHRHNKGRLWQVFTSAFSVILEEVLRNKSVKKWKKISEKLNFKLNFGFRLEENLYALRDQNIFPYQILCKWSKALFCMSCQKECEILFSSWVIVEHCDKNTDILRIPSLGLICSVLKSDIFVALFSTYICFKKIKNFVKPSWVNQSIQ